MTTTPSTALVTGAAGFVGSHLCERLLADRWEVIGLDAFTPYYSSAAKRRNLEAIEGHPAFTLVEGDLRSAELGGLLEGSRYVFHLAGQPGVRGSWADGFAEYVDANIVATQRLLEAARTAPPDRFIYSSSSSVYGNAEAYPCTEETLPRPYSPYGVTKLAAEHLCRLYADNWGLHTVALRYFTVYGPRQRPDMAFHHLINCVLHDEPFPMYGSGEQVRDFTYVSDVVDATVAAATAPVDPGAVFNIAGGSSVSLRRAIEVVESVIGQRARVSSEPAAPGDVQTTSASSTAAELVLGWSPSVAFEDGLARQVKWQAEGAGKVLRGENS